MAEAFFERPILNSPYEYPSRHWELDGHGQPTHRVELPAERLTARINDDSILELTRDLVDPSIVRNVGIVGEGVELRLDHLGEMRQSSLLLHLPKRLLYTKWRSRARNPSFIRLAN